MSKLTTAQIGKCGELLVQMRLLQQKIESSQMTTDSGIDLVAYIPEIREAITIQVKSTEQPKPGGGGRMELGWFVPVNNEAGYFAFVDLSRYEVWMFSRDELKNSCQQKSEKNYHLIMCTDPAASERRDGKPHKEYEFEKHKLQNYIHKIVARGH